MARQHPVLLTALSVHVTVAGQVRAGNKSFTFTRCPGLGGTYQTPLSAPVEQRGHGGDALDDGLQVVDARALLRKLQKR